MEQILAVVFVAYVVLIGFIISRADRPSEPPPRSDARACVDWDRRCPRCGKDDD
jgi:hypothetical protein